MEEHQILRYWTGPKLVTRLHSVLLKARKAEGFSTAKHSHIYNEVLYVDYGKLKIVKGNNTFVLNPGECFFIKGRKKHIVSSYNNEACNFLNIMHRGIMPDEIVDTPIKLTEKQIDTLRQLREYASPPVDNIKAELAACKLSEFILLVLSHMQTNPTKTILAPINRRHYRSKIVNNALDIIMERYAEDMKIGDIAKELGISASHLATLLKKETNTSFLGHLQQVRIEKAKELIQKGMDNINSIAFKIGYRSQPFFFKIFRRYTDMTPLEFAKTLGTPEEEIRH